MPQAIIPPEMAPATRSGLAFAMAALLPHSHPFVCLNPASITAMFLGGAAGSGSAMLAWSHLGWAGVCTFGGCLAFATLVTELAGRRRVGQAAYPGLAIAGPARTPTANRPSPNNH